MKKKIVSFTKKLVSGLLILSMLMPKAYVGDVSAADINNIPEPTYTVAKNMAGTDAFVYAYNVLDYGADNTGNADNTEIFQKLLNKTNQLGGGIVYVPSGKYKITGSLRIPKGVTLRGDWTKPEAGKTINNKGTILMAYVGRNQEENSTPFIEMEPETGCMELTIWYPEQDPNNIVKYSPTIRLGVNYYFGNEYSNVKNVTLVNSYIGVWYNRDNFGASPVVNGVYGTPLKTGVEIDCIADIGRIERVDVSPDYWSGSGFPNSPAPGSSFEDFIYNNGTAVVMRRNDWSYTCYISADGYNIGYNTKTSYDGNYSSPNGHHYKFNFKNCKNGIVFDTTNYVGILFDSVDMYNVENGIVVKGGTTFPVQFTNTKIAAKKYAINIDKTSSTEVLMYDSEIVKGLVNVDGGSFMCAASKFTNKAPEIVIGSLGRVSLSGNTFANGKQIVNNSIYVSQLDNANIEIADVPAFDDEKSEFKSNMPANLTLYDVTKAPYYADNSKNHGGGNDATAAIQNALNNAGANGGGIVFLPSGHYRVNGQLTIPSNVELRGATDVSSVPHGSGAILESYANKGNPSGQAFIRISANAGIRGVIMNYPEQIYSLDSNGEYHPFDYPFTMQGMGENIYVINVGIRAATGALDLATYRCDNHYVNFLAGHVNKVCVKVGNGTSNGIINNLMFNTIIYACGTESKFGSFPNSPSGDSTPVYDQQLRELEFIILGDCNNQSLYNCFPYGAYIGVKFVNEGQGGPQNLMSMGLGVDGSRKSLYFASGLTGKMDFINSQIVSLNNDQPITRYFETEPNTYFTANLYNTDLWGYPEKSVVMAANGGRLNLYNANFQMRGYNGAFNVENGSRLDIVTSNVNPHNSSFSTGANNISVISSVADYTTNEGNAFRNNINNFSNTMELSQTLPEGMLDRTGWVATASTYNENAWMSLDGNLNSQWTTMNVQTPGQWYQVDMGSVKSFDMIVTTLGATNDVPRGYKVLISNDGTNWRQIAEGENNNIYAVGEQSARYIRIEQTGNEAHWWAVYEFYVMKSASYDVGDGEIIEEETTPPTEEQPTEAPTEETTTNTPSEEETTFNPELLGGTLLPASEAILDLSALAFDDNAYKGRVIQNMHLEGSSFTYNNVNGGKNGGKARVMVHYASNEQNVTLNLNVNNESNYTLSCPSTGSWSTFTGTAITEVNLNAGNTNTLKFGNATQGVNVDYVVVTLLEDVEDYVEGNIALGKSAKSSGNESDAQGPELAVDGNIGTRWSSNYSDDAWIVVDLEKKYSIDKVVLNWEAAYGVAYDIQVSIDGNTWNTVSRLNNQDGEEDIINFQPVVARYVKIQGVKRALEYGYSLWEMEVYCANQRQPSVASVEINGYQISTTVEGYRVIYSVSDEADEVDSVGIIYGLSDYSSEADMVVGSNANSVFSYEATQAGKADISYSHTEGAQSYVMTMKFIKNKEFYNAGIYVRAYARLKDGSYIYSNVEEYNIFKVADYLYTNRRMNDLEKHNYLYDNILSVVDKSYGVIEYHWGNVIIKPDDM